MNTSTAANTQESAHLEKLRTQISHDIEAMHLQEASLREYEQRLRLLVDHAHNSRPPMPAPNQYFAAGGETRAELDAEWDKHNRAHSLLEAARRGLSDDRMALKDREEKLHHREVDVTRREAWIKVREQELNTEVAARAAIPEPVAPKPSFTTAPFLAARNLLMARKG